MLTTSLLLLLSGPALAGEIPDDVMARFTRMEKAAGALTSYTYTFRRHEWTGGKQQDVHEMAVKFRKPMDIYMKWVGDTHTDRELLYRQGHNDGDMKVKPGPMIPTLNLNPTGKLAMRGSRHGIDLIDISNVVAIISDQTARIRASDSLSATYTLQGPEVINGEASTCLRADLPKNQDPALYAQRIDMCTSDATGLLVRLRAWDVEDGQLRKVEDYEFRDVTPTTLTETDFDPDNPAYNF